MYDFMSGVAQRRLLQFIGITALGLMMVVVNLALADEEHLSLVVATVILAFLGLAYGLVRRARVRESLTLLLVVLVLGIGLEVFHTQGLRNAVVTLAFGIPITIAAMLGTRRMFMGTVAGVMAVLALVALPNVLGYVQYPPKPVRLGTLVSVEIVLLALAFSIWVMSKDLRQALARSDMAVQHARATQSQLESLAYTDQLTRIPNRIAMGRHFETLLANAASRDSMVWFFCLGIDNLKLINESLGHSGGDALLQHVAATLRASAHGMDVVGRTRGDEFLIMCPDVQDESLIPEQVDKLVKQLALPLVIDGVEVISTCSMGVSVYPRDGTEFDVLLKNADTAMRHAKESGRNNFHVYNEAINSNVLERLHLLTGMRLALDQDQFQLHYQPQFCLKTGHVIGAEALLRWRHPELGLIPPSTFIPVAEKSGLIVQIGAWVVREACRQIRQWDREGLPELMIAVNLSSVQFKRDDIERLILTALDDHGLGPHRIELELTESLLLADSDKMTELLKSLSNAGLRFAIDDFGTGYSNLAYLKRFAVDRLKIDRSFVHNVAEDSHNEAIVSAVIHIARSLGMEVMAEGVEDQETLDKLVQLGCDHGQGWFWAKAMPASEFAEFVRSKQVLTA